MAKSLRMNENPLREANTQARSSLSLLLQRVQKPVEPPQKAAAPREVQPKKK
jgi:hypothetical protein